MKKDLIEYCEKKKNSATVGDSKFDLTLPR